VPHTLFKQLSIALCGAVVSLAALPSAGRAQSCVLRDEIVVDSNLKIRLDVKRLSTSPGNTDTVPLRLDPVSGSCRLQISPANEAGIFRISLQVHVTPTLQNPPKMVVQIVSADPNSFNWRMDATQVTPGQDQQVDIAIAPGRRGARAEEHPLLLTVRQDGVATVASLPFAVLWTPSPVITLQTPLSNCGADLCFYRGLDAAIQIRSADTSEINTRQPLNVASRKGTDADFGAAADCCKLIVAKDGLSAILPKPASDVMVYRINIPLRTSRLGIDGGVVAPKSSFQVTMTAAVLDPPIADVTVLTDAGGSQTELHAVRAGANGIPVRIARPGGDTAATAAFKGLKAATTYQLRDPALASTSRSVAEFHVDLVKPDTVAGILTPLSPTVRRTRAEGAPVLEFQHGDSTLPLRARLTVGPQIRIDRTFIERPTHDEPGAIVHPLEKVRMRIEGPGVGGLTHAMIRGGEATVSSSTGQFADTTYVDVTVGRDIRTGEPLRLDAGDELTLQVPVTIQPNQHPKPTFNYIRLRVGNRAYDLDALTARDTALSVSALSRLTLSVNDDSVDTDKALYGVQYLNVDVTLRDVFGNDHGTVQKCIAIVPPDVGSARYQVTGTCTLLERSVSLSDLVPQSYRATARSQVVLRIKHDPSQYPNESVPLSREVIVQRGGRWIVEPQLQLPSGLIAWNQGRFAPGLNYSAAMFNLQPAWGEVRTAQSVSFQAGLAFGTKPNAAAPSGGSLNGQLSTALGVAYTFKNMVGDRSLNLFFGPMFPFTARGFRKRDLQFVFSPGFSVPIGADSPHS
jgi:hypothetical protein